MRVSNLFILASAATSAVAQYYGDQYDIDGAQYNIDDAEYDSTEFIPRQAVGYDPLPKRIHVVSVGSRSTGSRL